MMKKGRSMVSMVAVLVLLMSLALTCTACKKTEEGTTIRYLNFKPEIADKYKELAKEYEKETGVKVIVETAANNAYEETLTAKMATAEAPTLFQINGPKGYANWKDYCADLTDSKLYDHLIDKSLAVTGEDGKVYGIPYVVEGYGIIYNTAITDKYFTLSTKSTPYTSMEEINSFDRLKALVEDMQANKAALGIDGVFASTSMKSGEDWRWQTHLANLPLYYEFEENDIDLTSNETKEIAFSYADQFRHIFDLYLNNSVVDRKTVGTKTVVDSMAEFALEKCAMVQNGNWAWGQVKDTDGNKVKADNVKYLPIYIGADNEEMQGLCVGTENFYAVNAQATEVQQQAAKDFIYWLYSSTTGKQYVTEEFGFIAPFDTFTETEKPDDPLAREVLSWMSKDGIVSVPWNFTIFPSAAFKEDFGASLLKYAQGTKDWNAVKQDMVNSWNKESAISG